MKDGLLVQRLTILQDEADYILQHILLGSLTPDHVEEMIGALGETIKLCQQWIKEKGDESG